MELNIDNRLFEISQITYTLFAMRYIYYWRCLGEKIENQMHYDVFGGE